MTKTLIGYIGCDEPCEFGARPRKIIGFTATQIYVCALVNGIGVLQSTGSDRRILNSINTKMCVCECERKERKRGSGREGAREREGGRVYYLNAKVISTLNAFEQRVLLAENVVSTENTSVDEISTAPAKFTRTHPFNLLRRKYFL